VRRTIEDDLIFVVNCHCQFWIRIADELPQFSSAPNATELGRLRADATAIADGNV
jgi:hypothetical protein